jgi:hypothetical protein
MSSSHRLLIIHSPHEEIEIGRLMVQGQPGEKVSVTPISANKPVYWHTHVIPVRWEA